MDQATADALNNLLQQYTISSQSPVGPPVQDIAGYGTFAAPGVTTTVISPTVPAITTGTSS